MMDMQNWMEVYIRAVRAVFGDRARGGSLPGRSKSPF